MASLTPDLLTWTIINRYDLRPGAPFDLVNHPYLVDLYRCTAKTIVVRKAGQIGVSEWLVSYALHAADVRQMDILYLMPTEQTLRDFSTTRLGMAAEASPYLRSILVQQSTSDRRGSDSQSLKRVRNNWIYMRGASVTADASSPKLKSVPADGVIMDEFDEIDERAPELARKRMGHSKIAEERSVSTPTYPGVGIDAEYANTTQMTWHIQCEHCGNRQDLSIDDLVLEWDSLERPVVWHGQQDSKPYVACRRCKKPLDRGAPGLWVPKYPEREIVGFHMSKLIAPLSDLRDIIKNLQTTNEDKRKEAYNQDLGLPYKPRGGGLTIQNLDDARRSYHLRDSAKASTVMGVDVGLQLHVVIRQTFSNDGTKPMVWAGAVSSFDDVGFLIRKYQVRTCVIDAMPETRKARELQANCRHGTVWLCYYDAGDSSKREDIAAYNDKEEQVSADRTRSIDETVTRIIEGVNTLPEEIRSIQDYYTHMTSVVRVTEKRRDGNMAARWVETGPDHYMHAENYCTIASMRGQKLGILVQAAAKRRS